MSKCVLIGGGSGLIGTRLTELLLQKGYRVRHLGRKSDKGAGKKPNEPHIETYSWDPARGYIDEAAFEGVDAVINLAGANINARWTDEYKKKLLDSRIQSTKVIVDFLNNKQHSVSQFISGSAIGYYGFADESKWFHEDDAPGSDFLSQLVVTWEKEASKLRKEDVTLAFVRTGIAFTSRGGALEAMEKPIRFLIGAPLGTGEQIVSWIHIDDLCNMFIHIFENNLGGAFNGVAPDPASNERITKGIAARLRKPLILPNIPSFALKIILGEMADSVLNGSQVSPHKIRATGFEHRYPNLDAALDEIYRMYPV